MFQRSCTKRKWIDAMDEEIMKAIIKNDPCEIISLSRDHKDICVKWVYKTKKNSNRDLSRKIQGENNCKTLQ